MSNNVNLSAGDKEAEIRVNNFKNFRFKFNKKLIVPIIIALTVPLTVILALTQTNILKFAGGGPQIASVAINPGSINVAVNGRSNMSTLAYDSAGKPVFSGVLYEWSMSSTNSVGTLSQTFGDLNEFLAFQPGCGEITVIARKGTDVITKSISVAVASGNILPDCGPTPTPSPTEIITPSVTQEPSPTFQPTSGPSTTPTSTPIPGPNKLTLTPIADSFVRSTQPNKNFGTNTSLETDTSPAEISYMMFNLAKLSGKTIVSAKLYIKVSDSSRMNHTLRRGSNKNWSEKGITYRNKPGFESTIKTFSTSTPNSVIELDVKKAVDLRKGGKLTLGITSLGDDTGAFYSRESGSANKPQLVIEYQ